MWLCDLTSCISLQVRRPQTSPYHHRSIMFLSPESARRDQRHSIYPGESLGPNEIRLVRLCPGAWSDPIVCELTNVKIEVAVYQTLSYVWGSRHVHRDIKLQGRRYSVTVNLEGALRHLRSQNKDGLVLWVDALCMFCYILSLLLSGMMLT